MKLENVRAEVANQLRQQAELGVQTIVQKEIPDVGPSHGGLWLKIPEVTVVFADMKGSTALNAEHRSKVAARAYTYFIRAMTVILDRFSAGYIEVQGDGIFGLFSGKGSIFLSAVAARTMLTVVDQEVSTRLKKDTSSNLDLRVGIGVDHGTLLVRRLGLKGVRENEVWADNPVNMAAKLSSAARPNEIAVSERVFNQYNRVSKLRQQAILQSCGCNGSRRGQGLDTPPAQRSNLWQPSPAPKNLGLDFDRFYRVNAPWCKNHGAEFCDAIITGERPSR